MTKSRITEKNLLPQVMEKLFATLNNNFQLTNITNFITSNGKFTASISNFKEETSKYCFFVTHDESRAIIWTANRNHPISYSYKLYLSTNGLAINTTDNSGTTTVVWSAQALSSSSQVSVMKLQDSGNLVLLYRNNVSSWESFDHPTDTMVMG